MPKFAAIGSMEGYMTFTVGKLSKMFGISRTALLYYDQIGLLCPTARNTAGYRLYSQADADRLEQIMILKHAGVPINEIRSLISTEETIVFGRLMKRLGEINLEIEKLKNNQKQIIGIMSQSTVVQNPRNADPILTDQLIHYAEIDDSEREQWHVEFEAQSPELHDKFLTMLGFGEEEVQAIRNKCR